MAEPTGQLAKLHGTATNEITLAGNEEQLKTQISLLMGLSQIQDSITKGLDVDFMKFVEDFEMGFSLGYMPKLNKSLNPQCWGQHYDARPWVRILIEEAEHWSNQGYYIVEFFPNRMVETESYLLFGTPKELINQLILFMNMKLMLNNLDLSGGGDGYRPLPVDAKGKIHLKFYFKGIIQNSTVEHRIEKSFRLMKDDPVTISDERVFQLGELVKSLFNGLQFWTGHDSYTYNFPEHGFNRIWGYFRSQQDALTLYERMAEVSGHALNIKFLSKSSVPEPGDRFSQTPASIIQAGRSVRSLRERPIAQVKFYKATIKFPHVTAETSLVDESGKVTSNLNILNKLKVKA